MRLVSTMVLVFLVGLPIAATVCAATCEPVHAANASTHHQSAVVCEEHGDPVAATLNRVPGHHCDSHEALIGEPSDRAIDKTTLAQQVPAVVADTTTSFLAPPASPPGFARIALPAASPPQVTSPVLRV
jgi:hypothetical protein